MPSDRSTASAPAIGGARADARAGRRSVERVLGGMLLVAVGAHLLVYLGIVFARIGYPFELEWMEGGMLAHVQRVLAGQPIYARPSLDFVSYMYPPLYYYAAAVWAWLGGADLQSLRALSVASSLACFGLIFEIVRRESGNRLAAAFAAGLFAATFERAGAWLDLARADSFYLMWLLACVAIRRAVPTAAGAAAAGVAIACAFFVKQSVALVAGPLALAVLLADRRRALVFVGTSGALVAIGIAVLDWLHGGWFLYYTFSVPRGHPTESERIWSYWTADLWPVGVALLATLVHQTAVLRSGAGRDRLFFPLLLLGLLLSSWSVRSLVGAHLNNLLPVFSGVAIGGGLALAAGLRVAPDPRARAALIGLAVAQLGLLVYDPRPLIPTRADREAGERLVERLRSIDGEVFFPNHGYLAQRAGKRAYAHTLAIDNLLLDDFGPARQALEAEFLRRLESGQFAAMVVDSDRRYVEWAQAFFGEPEPLFERPDVFFTVSGGRIRPETLYRRR